VTDDASRISELEDQLELAMERSERLRRELDVERQKNAGFLDTLTESAVKGPGAFPSVITMSARGGEMKSYVPAELAASWHRLATFTSAHLLEMVDHVVKQRLGDAHKQADDAIAREYTRVRVLEKALRPFAKFAESLPPIIPGRRRLSDDGPALSASRDGMDYQITYADFRKALEVLPPSEFPVRSVSDIVQRRLEWEAREGTYVRDEGVVTVDCPGEHTFNSPFDAAEISRKT
jgi:hypothetical protein